jgi:hypothetical protein
MPARIRWILLIAAASWGCRADAHPADVVGVWVKDSTMPGGSLRVIDTLELRPDGAARGRSGLISQVPITGRPGGYVPAVTQAAETRSEWEVVREGDGRRLCLFEASHGRRCVPYAAGDGRLQFGAALYLIAR